MSDNIIFHVWRQDRDGLNKLACAIMNTPEVFKLMNAKDEAFYDDGVMLNDCEADTWASSTIDKDTAYTWLSDALLYFCTAHPDKVQIGIDRIKAGIDEDFPIQRCQWSNDGALSHYLCKTPGMSLAQVVKSLPQ